MRITVNTSGNSLADLIRRKPEEFRRQTDRAAGRGALELARAVREKAPKADSTLANTVQVQKLGVGYRRVIVGAAYGRPVEEGADPSGFPPERAIEDWIQVRGIEPHDPEMTREDLAYVIARSIFQEGTEPQPFFAPAWEENKDRIQRRLDGAVERVMQA